MLENSCTCNSYNKKEWIQRFLEQTTKISYIRMNGLCNFHHTYPPKMPILAAGYKTENTTILSIHPKLVEFSVYN
jgi:hypothetical protein